MSYYYLISGLPDLTLEVPVKIDFQEALDTIERNLEEKDKILFPYVIYPNDNRNFLNFLFHEHKDFPSGEWLQPSILAKETIQGYHRARGVLPPYMEEFVSDYQDQFSSMTLASMEERLREMFYDEVKNLPEPFIMDYFGFEEKLRKAVAAYNFSYFNFLSPLPDNEDDVFHQLGKHKSIPASLQHEYPFLNDIGEVFEELTPGRVERWLDQIKWDYLSNLGGFFKAEHVLAYTLKLLIVWRWQRLEKERDQPHFKTRAEKIKTTIPSPKIPLI